MAHSLVDDEIQSCIESAEPITIMLPRHQTPGRRKLNMKKKIMSMVIAAAAMALSLVGCGVDINSIGLPPNVVMEKGETQQLEIEYGTDDKAEQEKITEAASKLTIEWTSSDEEVASCLYTQIPESRINTELFNHHQKTEYPYNHTENAF